jgi:hypothetical protein
VGVVVVGQHAFVASDGGGLFVVEWSAAPSSRAPGRPFARGAVRAVQTAASCRVTSAADDGPGSLRACVATATDGSVIDFDPTVFPPSAPATIRATSTLRLPSGITIDASAAGVVIDGAGRVPADGIYVASRTVLRGLTVTGFRRGIHVDGDGNAIERCVVSDNAEEGITLLGPSNAVRGNVIGLDPSGTRVMGDQGVGVAVGDAGNVIGGPAPADRNVISGSQIEIFMKEARETTIEGNYIGTDAAGTVSLRRAGAGPAIGVWVGSSRNLIARNIITGGVNILDPGSNYNSLVGNLIDLDVTGAKSLGSGGIVVSEPFNRVGGTLPGEANVLSGGIVAAASDVIVIGNRIGMERGDPLAGEGAIVVERRGSVIGGRSSTAANVIFGVIQVRADSTLVIGDHIRPRQEDGLAGIRIEASGGVQVVANVIEGGDIGIELTDGARDNVVRGNVIRGSRRPVVVAPGAESNVIAGNDTAPPRSAGP